AQLAAKLRVSRACVSQWEKGVRAPQGGHAAKCVRGSAPTRLSSTFAELSRDQAVHHTPRRSDREASAADTDVLVSVNRDSRSRPLYLHLVNPDSAAVPVEVNITGPRFGPPGRRSSLGASRRTRT